MAQTKVTSYETTDWTDLSTAPNTVTANGNRSYSLVFNSTDYTGLIQPGTRIRTTRTVAAPTQCTNLNGTNQYFNKTSPAGMTFTNNFVVSAWIKITSYQASSIASRINLTSGSGWDFQVTSTGQVSLQGFNAGGGNYSTVTSFQSVPLNKWVHVAGQLDMATFTATPTTSYIMFDGVDVPASVARAGTNPTSLVQAGNLDIGCRNSAVTPGQYFPGKLAQIAIYSAKVTQATIAASISQGLAGTETSLISAYSFNNAITDLNTTNANNLTAQNSAVATNADSPFGGQSFGTISSTLDYGIVQSATFSTNTTLVVQVPEGCTIPTSGGVTTVSYSGLKAPYGMTTDKGKWEIRVISIAGYDNGSTSTSVFLKYQINIPIGSWSIGYCLNLIEKIGAAGTMNGRFDLNTTSATVSTTSLLCAMGTLVNGVTEYYPVITRTINTNLSSQTVYYFNGAAVGTTFTAFGVWNASPGYLIAELSNL